MDDDLDDDLELWGTDGPVAVSEALRGVGFFGVLKLLKMGVSGDGEGIAKHLGELSMEQVQDIETEEERTKFIKECEGVIQQMEEYEKTSPMKKKPNERTIAISYAKRAIAAARAKKLKG